MPLRLSSLVAILLVVSAAGTARAECYVHRVHKSDSPVELVEADRASLIVARAVAGMTDCQLQCGMYRCDLASFRTMDRLCRLLRVFPADSAPGGSGVSAVGSFGSEDGETLWLLEHFQQRLQDRRDALSPVPALNDSLQNGSTAQWQNISSGLSRFYGLIRLNSSLPCFEVTLEIDADSLVFCAARCAEKHCALLIFSYNRTEHCQLVHFFEFDAQSTHCLREPVSLGGNAGDELWLTETFYDQTASFPRRTPSSTRVANATFLKTGDGRLGSVQLATVPQTGCYRIEAFGASGGSYYSDAAIRSGRGAAISGFFNLTVGTVLSIVVGQCGSVVDRGGGGGGGGSFVYIDDRGELLLAAGGGGGAGTHSDGIDGQDGVNGTDSTGPNFLAIGFGGANGQSGADMSAVPCASEDPSSCLPGGPGAGWMSNSSADGLRGGGRIDGWVGGGGAQCGTVFHGSCGGFGGGGGGYYVEISVPYEVFFGGSGGGGGFSGGGAGTDAGQSGGGGGSFCSGSRCNAIAGGNSDSPDGRVDVTAVGFENCRG